MTVPMWAIKPGELKGLSGPRLVLLAARCATRAESCAFALWPEAPATTRPHWTKAIALVVAAARASKAPAKAIASHARAVQEDGARGCNRLDATDAPRGQCINQATNVLASAIDAARAPERAAQVKAVIEAAKHTASIAAVLAHAGRVPKPRGVTDVVDHACVTVWTAIRADVAALLAAPGPDAKLTLDAFGPLWAK